jgi:hypothetical protein
VVRQVLSDLRVRPAHFRASRRRTDPRGASILFRARANDTVDFRIDRAARRSGRKRIR